jgi:hypothetical protein
VNFAQLSAQAATAAEEASRRGDHEGDFYARGMRDAYATAAAFPEPVQPVAVIVYLHVIATDPAAALSSTDRGFLQVAAGILSRLTRVDT